MTDKEIKSEELVKLYHNMSGAGHEYEKNFNLLLKDFLRLFHDFQIMYGYVKFLIDEIEDLDDVKNKRFHEKTFELYDKWAQPTIRMIETFSKKKN